MTGSTNQFIHFEPVEMGLTDLHDSRCVPIVLIKAFIILLS